MDKPPAYSILPSPTSLINISLFNKISNVAQTFSIESFSNGRRKAAFGAKTREMGGFPWRRRVAQSLRGHALRRDALKTRVISIDRFRIIDIAAPLAAPPPLAFHFRPVVPTFLFNFHRAFSSFIRTSIRNPRYFS